MSNLDGVPYYSSALGDVPVAAAVAPLGLPPDGSFGSMRTSCVVGGSKMVDSLVSRDAIPAGLRAEGMTCFVQATQRTYQLQGGILNANWAAFGAGTLSAVLVAGNTTGGTSIIVSAADTIVLAPATTSGALIKMLGGYPVIREGDDSAFKGLTAASFQAQTATDYKVLALSATFPGVLIASDCQFRFDSATSAAGGAQDTGLSRQMAGAVAVTNGSTNVKGVTGAQVTLTDAVATTVLTVPLAAGARAGGTLRYSVDVTNATDFQVLTGQIAFACVDKTGTLTSSLDTTLQQQALAVSAGTLTPIWTILDGANLFSLQLSADTSLAGATLVIRFNLDVFGGTTAITIP